MKSKPEQPEKGMEYTPVTLSTGNNPDEVPSDGKPDRCFFNIDELQKEHPGRRSWSDLAVRKNRAHANIICGYAADVKHKPGDLGTLSYGFRRDLDHHARPAILRHRRARSICGIHRRCRLCPSETVASPGTFRRRNVMPARHDALSGGQSFVSAATTAERRFKLRAGQCLCNRRVIEWKG